MPMTRGSGATRAKEAAPEAQRNAQTSKSSRRKATVRKEGIHTRSESLTSTFDDLERVKLDPEETPSREEFQSMGRFHGAQAYHQDGSITLYRESDEVCLVPEDAVYTSEGKLDQYHLWRARILEIRCPDISRPSEVWVLIAWYWSPIEFRQTLRPTFNVAMCGVNELIYVEDLEDLASNRTLAGHTQVYVYDDSKHLCLDHISATQYFSRTEYSSKSKKFKRQAKPSCVCRRLYNPDDVDPMIFCPRCLRWFHTPCLNDRRMYHPIIPVAEAETIWESTNDESSFNTFAEELKSLQGQNHAEELSNLESQLQEIRDIARRPCMRGGLYGMVGNAGVVLRARYLLQTARKPTKLPSAWRVFVWGESGPWFMPPNVEETESGERRSRTWMFLCPRCKSPI